MDITKKTLAFRIRYVNGVEITGPAESWCEQRSEGVDWFEIMTNTGATRFSGKSLYWLYERDGIWYAGGCGVGYDSQTSGMFGELVIEDGIERVNLRKFVPDIKHNEVKLGWWWVGTEANNG